MIAAMTCTDGTVKAPLHNSGGGCLLATGTDPRATSPSRLTTDEC
jgi:hypothetical protein